MTIHRAEHCCREKLGQGYLAGLCPNTSAIFCAPASGQLASKENPTCLPPSSDELTSLTRTSNPPPEAILGPLHLVHKCPFSSPSPLFPNKSRAHWYITPPNQCATGHDQPLP